MDFLGTEGLRVIAALGSFCLISKTLVEWLILFDGTAFYIKLIQEAISDITYFMLIFLVTIYLFGIPIALISLNWFDEEEAGAEGGEAGSEGLFRVNPYNILYLQYLIALGEFPLDDWGEGDKPFLIVVEIIFLGTTFLQTITMLNVLVAIMMESFNRINNASQINNNKMKINTISQLEV